MVLLGHNMMVSKMVERTKARWLHRSTEYSGIDDFDFTCYWCFVVFLCRLWQQCSPKQEMFKLGSSQ